MHRAIRLLAVCTDYPPAVGGIATLSSQTVRHLAAAGHEVKVVCGRLGGRDPVTSLPCAAAAEHIAVGERLGLREFRLARLLPHLVQTYDPDVIWSSTWFPGAALMAGDSRRAGRVVCFSAYASEILPSTVGLRQRAKSLLGPWRRRALAEADCILAISSFTRSALIRLGAPDDRVAILPGGVAEEWFQVRRGPQNGTPRILTVARLDAHKGHDVVIRSLPFLVRTHPDLVYEIVGAGDSTRLRRLAAELGVQKHISFRGALDREGLFEAMSSARVFVMPSRQIPGRPDLIEAFGLTFLEAAAAGIPAVAGRSGGVCDAVIDGVTGLLVDPCSPEEVGTAIHRLISNEGLADRFGTAARARAAAEFTWPRIVQRMLETLEPCLQAMGR
jgi:phosphatidylinositol alpha-1,6-mannosyltransferase